MPKKPQKQAWMSSFVNVTLDTSDKQALNRLAAGDFSWDTAVDEFLDDGLKVTFRRETRGGGVAVWLQETDDGGENAKLILTGHGREPRAALLMAYYLHVMKFDRKWPEYNKEEGVFYWDDIK